VNAERIEETRCAGRLLVNIAIQRWMAHLHVNIKMLY
jgi:hypothetical protein